MQSMSPDLHRHAPLLGNAHSHLLRSHLDFILHVLETPLAATQWSRTPEAIEHTQTLLAITPEPVQQVQALFLGAPFDMALYGFQWAQRCGAIESSMLTFQKFNRTLSAIERLTLGPWARR